MKSLRISETLSLPIDAVTQTFADLGIRGSGKTNTGVVMMEEMMKAEQQAVALDPTDAWYGIRSSSDGKGDGFKVIIMGGPHGDLPLTGMNGTIMAEFVVDSGASVVFSLRHLSISDQRRFAQDFAEKLYDLKGKPENRTPLHIFLDEADEFVPQRIPHGFERMFGAYDRLVRRGRSSGIGLTLISQRAQVLNKDVLSQCETLICHRLLHKLDRKAIEAWIEAHDTEGQSETFMAALASLERGTAWVWSPSWLNVFRQVPVRLRETFDSSFTPKAGQKAKTAAKLAEVDLEVLKQRLSATIEKAKHDDPAELRKRIHELEGQIKAKPIIAVTGETIDREKLMDAERAEIERIMEKSIIPQIVKMLERVHTWVKNSVTDIQDTADHISQQMKALQTQPSQLAFVSADFKKDVAVAIIKNAVPAPAATAHWKEIHKSSSTGSDASLPKGERIVLTAIAQFEDGVERDQLSVLTGYKRSSRDAYVSRLKERGHIEDGNGKIIVTVSGIAALGSDYEPLPTGRDLYDHWMTRLPEGERRILEVLYKHPKGVDRQELDEVTGYKRSSRDAYLSRLAARRLVSIPRSGMVSASENLY